MALIEKENTSPNIGTRIKNAPINRIIRTKIGTKIEKGITRVNTEIKTKTNTNIVPVLLKTKRSMIAAIRIKRRRAPPPAKTRNTRVAAPPVRIRTRARTKNIIISPAPVLRIRTSKT